MKKLSFYFLLFAALFLICPLRAEVYNVHINSITPSNPSPGDMVAVNFSYCVGANERSHMMLAVSTFNSFQPGNTAGQTFKVNESGIDVGGTGAGAASVNGGYNMNDQQDSGFCNTVTWNIHIPDNLSEGTTYYIVVGGKIWWVDSAGSPPASQNSMAFTIPAAPPDFTISKKAEATSVKTGDYVLYTIDYNFVNSTGFIITDVVPPYCTLVEISPGGSYSGTASGSTLQWNIGSAATRKRGQVWFLTRATGSPPGGTVIHNVAHGRTDQNTGGKDTNDSIVSFNADFALMKSQSHSTAVVGNRVTYTFDFSVSGFSLKSYDSFDSGLSGFHTVGPGNFYYETESGGNGYVRSPAQGENNYPHLLRDTPANFCYGMVEADVWVGDKSTAGWDYWDGLITFRDNNLSGSAGRAYGIGISADGLPANMYIQEVNPPETTWAVRATSNGVSIYNQVWYTIKVLVTDAGSGNLRIQAKAWQRGTAEPGSWMIDWTDNSGSTPPCGYVGLQGHPRNPNLYDNLKIFSYNQVTNARLYDNIPTCINYVGGTGADAFHTGPNVSGGQVRWNFPGILYEYTGRIQWWGDVTCCGTITNVGTFDSDEPDGPFDSNKVIMDVPCPPTPTPTFTRTYTRTVTRTYTRTATPTYTHTATSTGTYTRTSTSTFTSTFTASATRTVTMTSTATRTNTMTHTMTATRTNTATSTATYTFTITHTDTFTKTYTSTMTITGTQTFTRTSTPTWTQTSTWTWTFTNTVSRTQTLTVTPTPTETDTNTQTNTSTATPTFTATKSRTPTWTQTSTRTMTDTFTFTMTYTDTRTPTPTNTNTNTRTNTSTETPTWTQTSTRTMTDTFTFTMTYTDTRTPTPTNTNTNTRTNTSTETPTWTQTSTRTMTNTHTLTWTYTETATLTFTPTWTPTWTVTFTITDTPTITPTSISFPYLLTIVAYNEAGEKVKLISEDMINKNLTDVETFVNGKNSKTFNPYDSQIEISIPGIWTPEQMGPGVDRINFAWNGLNENGQTVDNGIYYLKISVQDTYGHIQTTTIDVSLLRTEEYIKVNVFNTAGELVRWIGSNDVFNKEIKLSVPDVIYVPKGGTVDINCGQGNVVEWDGKNSNGYLVTNGSYEIQVQVKTSQGYRIVASKKVTVFVGEDTDTALFDPQNPDLYPKIYPNPKVTEGNEGEITIEWFKPSEGEVRIRIYNVAGELVKQIKANLADKSVKWDLKTQSGKSATSGTYIVVLDAKKATGERETKVKKCSIIKSSRLN